MQMNLIPFNVDLLMLKDQDVKNIPRIKVLDIFDGFSRNFHRDGLFSTDTFGKVGEERRNRLYAYIDLRLPILHPILFKTISDLKGLYEEIIAGKTYATFNKDLGDFEKADVITGKTGYSFFMQHLPDLKLEERPGPKREFNIKLFEKYRNNTTFNKLLVLPAGLRDYEVDENGKPSEDEINGLYRKVLSISNMIENINLNANSEYLDASRFSLQIEVNKVYAYIKNILEGKKSFILGKWASRKIFNSTRNVITSYIHTPKDLNDPTTPGTNQSVVGLYQFMRAILPLAIKQVRDGFLSEVFLGPNSPAALVNRDTFKKELVPVDPEYYDSWMTNEGIEKLMAKYGQENLRHDYLSIGNYYFGLIYKGNDGAYKIFQDKDDLPDTMSMDDVTPLTFTELLYLSVFKDSDKIPALVTRYPISGYGSIYPSYVYLKTTVKSEVRYELDHNWEKTDNIAKEFPILGQQFFNSISVAVSHIARMGADQCCFFSI